MSCMRWVGDGIANQEQVDVSLFHPLVKTFVPLHPVWIARNGDDSVVRLGVLFRLFSERGSDKNQSQNSDEPIAFQQGHGSLQKNERGKSCRQSGTARANVNT